MKRYTYTFGLKAQAKISVLAENEKEAEEKAKEQISTGHRISTEVDRKHVECELTEVRETKHYNVAVTLPLTLWVEVDAISEEDAREQAKEIALKTPYKEWGDDFSYATLDIVKD